MAKLTSSLHIKIILWLTPRQRCHRWDEWCYPRELGIPHVGLECASRPLPAACWISAVPATHHKFHCSCPKTKADRKITQKCCHLSQHNLHNPQEHQHRSNLWPPATYPEEDVHILAVLTHHILDLPVDLSHQRQDHSEVDGRSGHAHVYWTAQFSCHSNGLQITRNTNWHGYRSMALWHIQDLDTHMHEMHVHYLYTHNCNTQCCCGGRHWLAHPSSQVILLSIHCNLINIETELQVKWQLQSSVSVWRDFSAAASKRPA